MFIKLPTLFYIMAAQIHASDEYDAARRSMGGRTMNKHDESTAISPADNKCKFPDVSRRKKTPLSLKDLNASTMTNNINNIAKKEGHDEDSSDDSSRGYLDDYSYEIHSPTSCKEVDINAPPFTPGIPGLISPCPPKRIHDVTASRSKF